MKRMLALLLALSMLLGCTAQAEGISTPTDTAPTSAPTEAATEEPTAAPTESATEEPTPAPTEAATEEPTPAPTEAATEEPTAAPTEVATEEPTPAPTEEATEEPTEAPTEEPTPEAPAWDESLCDHANENCEQAPLCEIPECWHIGLDANGLEYPLCEKGRWLLDQQDRLARENGLGGKARSVRSDTIDLDKADATIYRSGSYKVTGGSARPGAKLTIAADRLVVLEMKDAALETLRLGDKSQATLHLRGRNTVEKMNLGRACDVRITEGGALTVGEVIRPEGAPGEIAITGGSVKADLAEKDGRTLHAFDAAEASSVTVDGEAKNVNIPHADGKMYLWLKAPAPGKKWAAAMNGTALAVVQADDQPQEAPDALRPGEVNELAADRTYTLTGAAAEGTLLKVDQPGVTLVLENVTFTGTLVEATVPYTLRVKGETTLGASGVPGFTGTADVYVQGRLTLPGGMPENANFAGGMIVLPGAPDGWAEFSVAQALNSQSVTLDGEALPLLVTSGGALLLPAPAEGVTYAIAADETTVTVHAEATGEKWFTLSGDAPYADAADAKAFTVEGGRDYVTGQITAAGADASADFRNVKVQGDGAVMALSGEHLRVTLTGDNGLVASAGDAIRLMGDSTLEMSVSSGRLLLRRQADMNGLTLRGNVKVEPEPSLPHVSLMIRDGSGNPVPNTAVTVMIGGERYEYITHFDGSIHLWGMGRVDGQDVAVSDGSQVYTAVVMGGQGEADTGVSISNVSAAETADGLRVTFQAKGAASMGVQAYAGAAAADMADAFLADALHFTGADGAVTLTGLTPGQVVTFRVYASAAKGAELTAETEDGFQFSPVYTHTLRGVWTPDQSADAQYTGKAYRNPLTLPEGALVTYEGDRLNGQGMPVRVGKYVMKVVIPEGDPRYLPGVVEVPFAITRIPLTIIPEPNQEKYQGEMDPVFLFTVKGLLPDDELLGELLRAPGEDVGNYDFTLDGFDAPDYYTLRLGSGAHVFTILPAPAFGGGFGGFGGTFEVLRPVRQEIIRKDKRAVAVMLNTQDTLTVNYSQLGSIIFDTEDDKVRPFCPSLSWNEETDEILLRLLTEAELNKDGGYVTDASGEPLWRGRSLRLSWLGLRHLNQLGVDAVSLNNGGAALTVPLSAFLTEEMEALVKEHKGSLKTVRFRLDVVPADNPPEAAGELQSMTRAWKMAAYMMIDRELIDITDKLPGMSAAVDLEPVAELLASVEMYEADVFPGQFVLAQADDEDAAQMESVFVEPYFPDELDLASYPCVMYTHRYLMAPVTRSGWVFTVKRPSAP